MYRMLNIGGRLNSFFLRGQDGVRKRKKQWRFKFLGASDSRVLLLCLVQKRHGRQDAQELRM